MSGIDLWYATRSTGIAALVLLSGTTVLGVMVAGRAPSGLAVVRAEVHRYLSLLAVVFLSIHVATAVADAYVHLGWVSILVPFASSYGRGWVALGTIGLDLLVAVGVTSALRSHLSPRVWRAFHWLAYLSWPVAVAHTIGLGTDMRLDWVLALVATCIAAVAAAGGWRVAGEVTARRARPATALAPRWSMRRGVDGVAS